MTVGLLPPDPVFAETGQSGGRGFVVRLARQGILRCTGETFTQPLTLIVMDQSAKPPYAQNWNLSLQRAFGRKYVLDARYVGTKGTHLPRNIEANPAIYIPLSLAVTFPFNLIVGIPLYHAAAQWISAL